MTQITNYHGRTGSGKSTRMKRNVFDLVGRHLFVVPRKQSIEECYDDLLRVRLSTSKSVTIIPFLRDEAKVYPTKIGREISDCAAKFGQDDHCCLIVTQAAFLRLNQDEFRDWHLKFDELLGNGNMSGSLHAPVMWPGLANLYDLQPLSDDDVARGITPDFLRLTARAEVEAKDVFADARLDEGDENLYQRAASTIPVYTDAKDWQDVRDRQCAWCSPWTLDAVQHYASVEIAACDIDESLMHLLAPRTYVKVLCPTIPSAAKIKVFFFDAGDSTCSSHYWTGEEGQRNLMLVGSEVAARGGADYWTCNESAKQTLLATMPKTSLRRQDETDDICGTWVPPQQDGTNRLRQCVSCAIFVSAKAQEYEAIWAQLHPSATKAAISKSREDQLIFQFVTRGAVREASYDGAYCVYVYDRQQAEALQEKLQAHGYPDVEIEHIALDGFQARARKARGRKPAYVTPGERRDARRRQNVERQRRHREKRRAAQSTARPTKN